MRRGASGLLVAVACLSLLLSLPTDGAAPIPGTPVQLLDLSPSTAEVPLGGHTNFSWGLFNGGTAPYSVTVSANASDPAFAVRVEPAAVTLSPDALVQVFVNVTAPPTGGTRTLTLSVRFATTAPTAGSLDRVVSLVARASPSSVDVLTAFIASALIIMIGFTAAVVFERTRVPDLLLLILVGLLLGPVASTYFGVTLVPAGILEFVTPYFTALALMFILFDGGLNLRLSDVARSSGAVALHTSMAFLLTLFGVAFVVEAVLGWPWLVGLLLGAILGGTSSDVVLGIVRGLRAGDETKVILSIEAVLTDIFSVVTVLALIELLRGGPDASATIVATELGRSFLVSLVFGIAAGVAWIFLLRRLEGRPFAFMLTIAVLLVVYAFASFLGGSGAMAAFVFGLILGNHAVFERRLGIRARFLIDQRIKQFHSELTFLVRTFFFVFLGLVFTIEFGGRWAVSTSLPVLAMLNGTFALFAVGVVLLFLTIVAVRYLTARVTSAIRHKPPAERRLLWSLVGRGFTVAVLASFPFTITAFAAPASPGDAYYRSVILPYQIQFLNIAFFIIILTVVATTFGVVSSERALGRAIRPVPVAGMDASGLAVLRSMDLTEVEISEEPPPPEQGNG